MLGKKRKTIAILTVAGIVVGIAGGYSTKKAQADILVQKLLQKDY